LKNSKKILMAKPPNAQSRRFARGLVVKLSTFPPDTLDAAGASLTARTDLASLLLAALDIAGHAAGDGTDSCAGPSAAPSDSRDPRPRRGAYGGAAHRSLLLRGHGRASDHPGHGRDGHNMSDSFHALSPLPGFLKAWHNHLEPDGFKNRSL
jgi:hypothetical protein